MTASERITAEEVPAQTGHVWRYTLAAGLVRAGDRVLDVACGIGYGAQVLAEHAPEHAYYGVDRDGVDGRYLRFGWFQHADLDMWVPPTADFDLIVSFETLEHLRDPHHLASQVIAGTRRDAIVSVPTVPTRHFNEYHLHDFDVDDVPRLLPTLRLVDVIAQPAELSHVYVFTRP